MDLVQRIENGNWLVSCAADRMMPKYLIGTELEADWRTSVFLACTHQGVTNILDVNWQRVKDCAMNHMQTILAVRRQLSATLRGGKQGE